MNGRTAIALTGSLLAHAALFGALATARRGHGAPPSDAPIAVDVIEGRGAASSPRPAMAPTEAPPAPASRVVRPPHLRATTRVRPDQTPSVSTPDAAPDLGELPAPELNPASVGDSLSASGGTMVSGSTVPGSGGGSTGSEGAAGSGHSERGSVTPDFRDAIHRRLAHAAKACYPAAARRFRLEGSAQVHFCVDGKGGAGAVNLTGTSGSPLLDRAATDCVVPGALPLPGTGCYTLSVDFTEP